MMCISREVNGMALWPKGEGLACVGHGNLAGTNNNLVQLCRNFDGAIEIIHKNVEGRTGCF
jgi:hypothetical protein